MKNLKRKLAVIAALAIFPMAAGCDIALTKDVVTEITTSVVSEENSEETESSVPSEENSSENSSAQQSESGSSAENSSSQKPVPKTETKLTGKLTVQIFINENGVGENAWTSILDSFEKANPSLNLTTFIGPNVNSQLASKWSSGKGTPDVVLIDGKGLSEYSLSASGSFMDLTSWYKTANVYSSSEKIWDKIQKEVVETNRGKIYKAPLMLNCYGLLYDKTSYSQNGLTIHNDFQGMLSNAAKLKSAGQLTLIYPGMYSNYLVWGAIMPAVASYGQEFFNRVCSADPTVFTDSRFVGILNNLKTLGDAGYISASATQDHLGAQSDWLNHKAALVASGIWLEAEMKNSIPGTFKMEFTTAGLNNSGQKPGVALAGVGVAISSKTKNETNAKTFVRYLYQDEFLKKLAVSYGYATISKNPIPTSEYSKTSKAIMEYIQSDNVVTVYKSSDWGNVGETFNNVANQIAQGLISVNEGCSQLVAAANKN